MTEKRLPAGWYSNPGRVGWERYWDGNAWTNDHRRRKKRSGRGKAARTYLAPDAAARAARATEAGARDAC